MKATMNIRNNARAIAASVVMIMTFVLTAAASGNRAADNEVQAAISRLENYSKATEASVNYIVPEAEETIAFDIDIAMLRLEETANIVEADARYTTPVVDDEISGYEVRMAHENMDQICRMVEESIRYTAPSLVD